MTSHPGRGSGDQTLRRPSDRDDLQQPNSGREPYRGDQAVPQRGTESNFQKTFRKQFPAFCLIQGDQAIPR